MGAGVHRSRLRVLAVAVAASSARRRAAAPPRVSNISIEVVGGGVAARAGDQVSWRCVVWGGSR
jgi:hypothetical protein